MSRAASAEIFPDHTTHPDKHIMKRFFHAELQDLHNQLVLMGEKALESVRLASECLMQKKADLAELVFFLDDEIDALEMRIDAEAVRYITLRAPVAADVRLLTVAMQINHELERIGDEATTIARKAKKLAESDRPQTVLCNLPKMAQLTRALLRDAMDTFIEDDSFKAIGLPKRDKEIDLLHKENYDRLSGLMADNAAAAAQIIDLAFISKSYERIGDHATNIAEEVFYLLRGEDVRHSAEVKRAEIS